MWEALHCGMRFPLILLAIGACLGLSVCDAGAQRLPTTVLPDHYDLAFDVTNLFDQLYDQSYGLPREGRAAVLTLRARLN